MDPINIHKRDNDFNGFEVYDKVEQQDQQIQAGNIQQNQQVQAGNVPAQNPPQNPPLPPALQDPIKLHIQEIERQKRLAQQGNDEPANEQQQQNQQELQQQLQQQAQHNLEMAQAQLQNVRLLNETQRRKENITLIQPSLQLLNQVYTRTGFEYTTAEAKKEKLLREAQTRRTLQGTLQQKITRVQQHPVAAANLSRAKAVSYTDKYLVSHYGEFNGEAEDYIKLRISLMKNQFYSILPVAELKKLPRLEILNRLTKEMNRENPNQELILFYQNLVELQNIEAEVKNKPLRINPTRPATEITAKERRTNTSYVNKLRDQIQGNRALSTEEKNRRIRTMNDVLLDTDQHFWQEKRDVEKKNITPAKREGVRSILAWMYRNCDKGNKSQEPLINVIANAKPDQLLHMFYLIENKMEAAPTAESFYEATNDYIPNLKVFSDRANWTKISQVAGFVLKNELIGSYLELDEEETTLKEQLADNNPHPLNEEQKNDAKLQLVLTKAQKIMRMYSAAGLEPNMPIQLIPSATLRAKIQHEVQELTNLYNGLSEALQQRLGQEGNPVEDAGEGRQEKIKNKKKIGTKNAQQHLSNGKSHVGNVMQAHTLLKVIGEKTDFITKNYYYSLTTSGISGILAIAGLISAIMSSVNTSKGWSTMAGLDKGFKTVGLIGDYISTLSNGGKVTGDVMKTLAGGSTSSDLPWIGRTSIQSYAESTKTIPGTIQFWAGAATVVAGTLQFVSNAMATHQSNYSLDKLENAQNSLNAFNQQTATIQNEQTRQRRQIQSQQLKNLMDHRVDMTTKQRGSSIVGMVSAGLTVIGGVLTMTGMLAAVGGILSLAGTAMNIGYGMIYAKRAKRASLKKAVDTGLKLDDLVAAVKQAYNIQNLSSKEEDKLRDQIRQEALAELGYSDYKAMYLGMCKEQAEMIYRYVFEAPNEDADLHASCKQILLSLKFKERDIKTAEHPYERNYPPLSLIYSRLTEGL